MDGVGLVSRELHKEVEASPVRRASFLRLRRDELTGWECGNLRYTEGNQPHALNSFLVFERPVCPARGTNIRRLVEQPNEYFRM